MLTLRCTLDDDSFSSYLSECVSISVCKNKLRVTIRDYSEGDRNITLSEEDTKQVLKLLKFELEN